MKALTYPELRGKGICYSRVHLDRLMRAKLFPQKINLSDARIVWDEAEIDAWLKAKADARPAKEGAAA